MSSNRYKLKLYPTFRRTITEAPPKGLPESVSAAVWEFVNGALLDNPHRVGKELDPPHEGTWSARRGTYRVLYEINDQARTVTVKAAIHRGDAYRT